LKHFCCGSNRCWMSEWAANYGCKCEGLERKWQLQACLAVKLASHQSNVRDISGPVGLRDDYISKGKRCRCCCCCCYCCAKRLPLQYSARTTAPWYASNWMNAVETSTASIHSREMGQRWYQVGRQINLTSASCKTHRRKFWALIVTRFRNHCRRLLRFSRVCSRNRRI